MAKFVSGDLRLKDFQNVTWGTDLDCSMFYDGTDDQLRVTCTISGVNPIEPYHLTTKWYVDTVLSGSDEHNELLNIQGGTTDEYYHLTNTQHLALTSSGGVDDASSEHHHNSLYPTHSGITTISGDIIDQIITDHGDLTGLGDDDHTQYILVDGTRGFTGTVSGIAPTDPNHLTTKQYVDDSIYGLDWKDSVLTFTTAASGVQTLGNRYIASATGGGWTKDQIYEWDGTQWVNDPVDEGAATWVEDEDSVYTFNGTSWVKFGNVITHNNLNGLQGGTTDEYYHLTSDQYSSVTNEGGVEDASDQHTHDDRYFTQDEITTIMSGAGTVTVTYNDIGNTIVVSGSEDVSPHTHNHTDITDWDEAVMDTVGSGIIGAGTVTVTYNDISNTITVSGSTSGARADGGISGDERGFTDTVSGIDPTQPYHLVTRRYVDGAIAHEHGRTSIADGTNQVTVNFTALENTDYTVNVTMGNITDSPPSIYPFIVSATASGSFTVDFAGDMDSANYYVNWTVMKDA